MNRWSQHGSYQLHWQGDVLLALYEGAWNEVAARRLHSEARVLWQKHQGPWGLLSDARDWEAGTPEALEAWWAFFEDAAGNGMVAVTDVLASGLHETMVQALAERAGRLARYQRSASIEAGLAWLAAQGLNHSPT